MFSKIVVGTDGSVTANLAVSLAVEIARQNDAVLHLVHAFRVPSGSVSLGHGGAAAAVDESAGEAISEEAGEKLLAKAAELAEGLTVHTHVLSGAAAEVLVRVAEDAGADLVVVGSKGMHGARRLIGSVPNSVAHNAPCHVLIAKTA